MTTTHSVEDVVEALRNAKHAKTKCSLLIGAGCSVDAGIPVASGIVREIEMNYPRSYARANPRTYPNCMAQLAHGERRRLIAKYVDEARVNWAHVGIAALIQHGFVDRVLTTNFDPLVMRACAMVGVFPAVYDFAASQHFKPADVADKAVFHLHGQRSGFVLLNTEKEVAEHKESLRPVFRDAGEGRLWIVVGYSGENDPVFDLLADQARFDFRLYWVGFRDAPAPRHVQERLLGAEKHAFFVPDHTADSFFVELTRGLEIFPPELIARPFTHVSRVIDTLTPFVISATDSGPDVLESARRRLQQAIESFEAEERGGAGAVARANKLLMEGKYEKILELRASAGKASEELNELAAWALIMEGNAQFKAARSTTGPTAEHLLRDAAAKYQAALVTKPDTYEALMNWGVTLADLAGHTAGPDARDLLREALEKYQAALAIKQADHETLYNWGNTLVELARLTTKPDGERLLREAAEKFQAAIEIKPDKHEALNNWGNTLAERARLTTGADAERLLREAAEKFQAAIEIKPDKHEALNGWGSALANLAHLTTGLEAERLFREAAEKFQAAIRIQPDTHEALNHCGSAHLSISALEHVSEDAKQRSLHEAERHLKRAAQINPGEAAYNLACLAARRGQVEQVRECLTRSRAAGTLPELAHLRADRDLDPVRETDWFREFLSEIRQEESTMADRS